MDRKIIRSVNERVYKSFPEVEGKQPIIKRQSVEGSKSKSNSGNYLLVYSGRINVSGGKSMPRYVRVVVNEAGKIVKMSTSR